MDLQVTLHQNIRFLLVEVEKQVVRTGLYLRKPTPDLAETISGLGSTPARFRFPREVLLG